MGSDRHADPCPVTQDPESDGTVGENPLVDELTASIDKAALLLWRLNQEVGVYSGATMEFSLQLTGEPWPITLCLDADGDVVWPREGELRIVVYADGRLARHP
jgi:hypothetical protein